MIEQGYALVDREKCFSYATCVDSLPAMFRLDGAGISVADESVAGPFSMLVEIAADCPMRAISVFPAESLPS